MIDQIIKIWNREKAMLALLLLIGLLGAAFGFTPSYFSNSNVLIGVCLFPFTLLIAGSQRNNFVYLSLIALFAVLTLIYDVRIFYFFALAFYFLWLIELFIGRLNTLVLFLIVFMSPFFIQVVTILGFPLRLTLSAYAGSLLKMIGTNVVVQGNTMIVDESMFSVDEACMGLNMLAISMLMGVFILAYRCRLSGTVLSFRSNATFFSVVFILNLITNIVRIIVLVYFRIPADKPMHEFVGILCLIAYVVIPLHFLSGWLVRKYGKLKAGKLQQPKFNRGSIAYIIVLPLLVLFVGASIENNRQGLRIGHANVRFGQSTPQVLSGGITKITTSDLLIYIKVIPEFFTGEHTPLMCWKGSGYDFSGVSTVAVKGNTIYKGTLIKDGKTLHTAWWYSNGQIKTISQLDWRLRMLKGEAKFCLVNVTATDEQTLMKSLNSIFTTNPIIIKS
jgi:exosortase N